MPTISPGTSNRYILQPGETLTIVTDAASTCNYGQLPYPLAAPDAPTSYFAVPSSSTIIVGPRADVSRWLVDNAAGTSVTVTQSRATPVPHAGNPPDLMHLYGNGAPTSATGANNAAPGSLYTDLTGLKLYIQGGTKAVPSWKLVTSA